MPPALRRRAATTLAVLGTALLGATAAPAAAAETCFRQCLSGKVTSSSLSDDQIRFAMKGCRDVCEGETRRRLDAAGLSRAVDTCRPEPVSLEEFRAIRGASPSYIVQSNAFTWDLRNPLKNKVIREVEIVSQTMELRDTIMTAPGTVLPGESETVLVAGFFDGYPNARYATKVKAIYACTLDPAAAGGAPAATPRP